MKTGEYLRNAFPPPDESFERAVQLAVNGLSEKVYGRDHKLRAALLLAVVLLMLAATGIAATVERWGIGEFTERSSFANLSDDAAAVITADFEDQILDTPYGTVTITEAIYDGMAAYILMEVRPKIESCMVIPSTTYAGNQAHSFGYDYPTDQSIEDYAQSLGYKKLLAFLSMSSETTAHIYDSQRNEDGSFSLMMWSYVRPEYRFLDALDMHFHVEVYGAGGSIGSFEMGFTIPLAGSVQRAASPAGEEVSFEGAGINVTGVEAIRTPMSTYIIVHHSVVDQARYQEYKLYRSLRFLDENGEVIPKGSQPLSFWVDRAAQQMGDETYYITNRLFEEMPEQITIGDHGGSHEEGWTEGNPHTFRLQ